MSDLNAIKQQINSANHIVIIQADNPDGDSLASALALESILGDQGKTVTLYCGVEIPSYLRHFDGWDRVVHDLPNQFDCSIIVDTASLSLLETLEKNRQLSWLRTKPCIIFDHHTTPSTIDFATHEFIENAVSTGELIYRYVSLNNLTIDPITADLIAASILSDSLGLTSEATTSESIRTMASLVDLGANIPAIDEKRRSSQKKSADILDYKGTLLQRIQYNQDGEIAYIHIPWKEIEKFSHAYNPSMLVIDEMRMVQGVKIAIAFKSYPDGRVTAKIRANYGIRIANKVAEYFGGGGHPYAAGFRVIDGRSKDDIIADCINKTEELLKSTTEFQGAAK